MKDIAIYGAGGFGREIACVINKINAKKKIWDLIGFFDDGIDKGRQVSHFGKVLGDIHDLNLWGKPLNVVFAIGEPEIIRHLVEKIDNPRVDFPNIIHPDAVVNDPITFRIGRGDRKSVV